MDAVIIAFGIIVILAWCWIFYCIKHAPIINETENKSHDHSTYDVRTGIDKKQQNAD